MTKDNFSLMTRRRVYFRLAQLFMLGLITLSFVVAALATSVLESRNLGWAALAALLASVVGFWWAGRQADRRGGQSTRHRPIH